MTKMEFLEGLRKALGNDLDRATVQENVNYYDGYISDEVSKGKTEEEVTAELGDPWVIAQTVIDAEEAKRGMSKDGSAYTSSGSVYSDPVYGDVEIIRKKITQARIRNTRHMYMHLALIHGGRNFC